MKKFYPFLSTHIARKSFIFSLFFLSAFIVRAQTVTSYIFSQSSGTYTPITGTLVIAATDHTTSGTTSLDGGFYPVTIPFTFNFNGTGYTALNISVNGFITFGTTPPTATQTTPISSTTAYDGAIAVMARDLWGVYGAVGTRTSGSAVITAVNSFTGIAVGKPIRGTGIAAGATILSWDATAGTITISANATATSTATYIGWPVGEIRTETVGIAPNRTFVIQFSKMADFNTTAPSGNAMDFQIRLQEGGGIAANQSISLVYGPLTNESTTARTNQVGLRGATNTDFNNRSSATDWNATIAGTLNTSSVTRTNVIFPASGLTYTWTPPSVCAGTPAPGNTLSSTATACAGVNFTLSLQNNPPVTGLTYQWQSSPDNVQPYTDIAGATSSTLTTSQTATSFYRAKVICNGGPFDFSVPVQVTSGTPLSGTYTINSLQPTLGTNFTSFADAVNTLSCNGISGPVVFNVNSGSGPYNEQVIIPAITGSSAVNTITFNGNGRTINYLSTTTAERAVIKLNGADYVTINNLLINATGSATTDYGYGVQITNDADNNTISNCVITTTSTPATAASTAFAGIVIGLGTTSPITTGNSLCDNNIITGNTITGGLAGIAVVANGSTNVINGNQVVNNTVKEFYNYGIHINGNDNTLIEGNNISRPTRSSVTIFYGINLDGVNTDIKVSKNKIHDPFGGSAASTTAAYGIRLNTSDATAGNENIISNNFIYNFLGGTGTQNGILNNSSDNAKIYYNSILLNDLSATCACAARGIYVQTTTVAGLDIRDNTVVVGRGGSGDKQAVYFEPTSVSGYTLDYNNYYLLTGGTGLLEIAHMGTTGYTTLAAWQTASGKDANSLNVDPLYTSSADLHLQASSPLSNQGTPIAGITTDIDGDVRNAGTPEIGADELPAAAGIDLSAVSLINPTVKVCYSNAETITVRITNNSGSPINFATNPVTVTLNVTGPVTTTLTSVVNTGTLASLATQDVTFAGTVNMSAPGTYTFNASTSAAGDVNAGNDAMSPETRTVVSLNAGTVSSSDNSFCLSGTPVLTLAGNAGGAIQWQQATNAGGPWTNVGTNTTTYTPSSAITTTTYYRVIVSCGTNTATIRQCDGRSE
jgi:hypothetical protein